MSIRRLRNPDKGHSRKSVLKLRRIYSGAPNDDAKLRALLFVMGKSEEEIDRIIEERKIKRANEADRTEG